jgi:hypothetical protein
VAIDADPEVSFLGPGRHATRRNTDDLPSPGPWEAKENKPGGPQKDPPFRLTHP